MHNMISSTGMDQDSQLAQESTYPNHHWVDVSSYGSMAMTGYGGEYYMPSVTHGLPSESIGGHMPPPPPPMPHTMQHQQQYSNQLPQLVIPPVSRPAVSWPSLQTNPGQSYSAPPVPIPARPAQPAPLKHQPKLPSLSTSSQPRKMLTREDRRRMCQYAEENPTLKQTEIGAKFGVERSTVSKVLRKKDELLHQEERSSSPIKKAKTKNVDIERGLANWVRNNHKKGIMVSDDEIEEKARGWFATTSTADRSFKISSSWLEKFKHKHGIDRGKVIRRASETAIPDSAQLSADSPSVSASQTPGGISPASPAEQPSPPSMSASRSPDVKEDASFADFSHHGYKHSQSTTSLSSAVTDPASSSFSGSAFSPGSQITFSPEVNSGIFEPGQGLPGSANFQRPRSQTFPNLDLEHFNQSQSEPLTPKYSASGTAPSSALESPAHELAAPSFGMDSAVSPPTLHHSRSSSSLGARSTHTPILPNATSPAPHSPSQEEARRAADTILNYMHHGNSGLVNNDDYKAILRVIEKLKLNPGSKTIMGIGGLSRIPEGDIEMTAPPPLSKSEVAMAG